MEVGGITSLNSLLAITSVQGPRRATRMRAEDLVAPVEKPRLPSLRKVDGQGVEAADRIEVSDENVREAVLAANYQPSSLASYGLSDSAPRGGRLVDLLA